MGNILLLGESLADPAGQPVVGVDHSVVQMVVTLKVL